jgi:hypothetical protein
MSEWTVDTLKAHIEALLAEKDKQIALALTSAEKAVTKAEAATERRFESVNEFRQTLSDQAGTFISRTEFNALKERMDRESGHSGGLADGWKWLLGVAALAVPVVLFLVK